MGLRATWLILAKDVRAQLRNRTILILGLVAPLTLAFVLNFVFAGAADEPANVKFDIGLTGVGTAQALDGILGVAGPARNAGVIELHDYKSEQAARDAVDRGEVGAAWILRADGYDSSYQPINPEIVVVGDVDAPTTLTFARSLAQRYATAFGTGELAARVAVETGVATEGDAYELGREMGSAPPAAVLEPIDVEAAEVLDLTTSLTAGLALFFGFFVAGLPLVSLLEERVGGTLARLIVAPIPSGAIVAGKALAAVVLGVASLVTLMAASALLMGADWGQPLGALVLAAAFVLAAVGLMTAAGSAAKTGQQASNVQGIVAMALGLLGGAFVPLPAAESSVLGRIRQVTPHGWFLEGLTDLRADGLAAALPAAAALLLIGAVFGIVGMAASYRALRR